MAEQPPAIKEAGATSAKETAQAPRPAPGGGVLDKIGDVFAGSTGPRGGRREGAVEAAAKSAARAIGSQIGREIVRGVLGGIFGGRKR